MQVWNVLHAARWNTGRKNDSKNRHLRTIAHNYIFATKACIDNRKNLLNSTTSSTYGELRPTNGWSRFGSLGHPCKFQRVSRLGSVTAWHSSSQCQPYFAALNRWMAPPIFGRAVITMGIGPHSSYVSALYTVCTFLLLTNNSYVII